MALQATVETEKNARAQESQHVYELNGTERGLVSFGCCVLHGTPETLKHIVSYLDKPRIFLFFSVWIYKGCLDNPQYDGRLITLYSLVVDSYWVNNLTHSPVQDLKRQSFSHNNSHYDQLPYQGPWGNPIETHKILSNSAAKQMN